MVIVNVIGGLGNQLFQYAAGRRLALKHNTELLLDSSGYGPVNTDAATSAIGHRRLLLFDFRFSPTKRSANPLHVTFGI